jgi:EmrB/QacA subfamily drug resistance transporter
MNPEQRRWWALIVLCLGELMIVLDTTVVNVALPSIQGDLHFSDSNLVWVVNAYMLTYGGFLLLGGRVGDLYGQRRVFLAGIVLFTLASAVCGVAGAQWLLVAARAVQGLGGAVVSAVALSLIMNLFPEPEARAKAMGVFGFVCAAGGSVGVLMGGLLTSQLDWHWVFLVNFPVGAAVYGLTMRLVHAGHGAAGQQLDVAGAITVTASALLAVYGLVDGNRAGWSSLQTLSLLGGASALFALFLAIEKRVRSPLVPLAMLTVRNVAAANIAGVMWAAAMFAWFFLSALYLQLVLGYDAMQVGLAFLPSNLIMAALSLGGSARLVMRYGLRVPLALGLLFAAAGLALFARAPVDGGFWVDVLPGMLLLGVGAGIALNPVLLAAMSGVEEKDAGLASGIVNTSFMMGGAIGLAVLASAAAARTHALQAAGAGVAAALNGGYHLAFAAGAVFALLAAGAAWWIREADTSPAATPA